MKTMASKLRGVFAAVATLLVALTIAPGIANADIAADATSTVTLGNIESGAQIDVYKVIDVNWDATNQQPVEPVYVWNAEVAAYMRGVDALKGYVDNDGNVTKAFESADAADVYDQIAAAIVRGSIKLDPAHQYTAGKVETSIELPMGGYLFIVGNSLNYVYQPIAQNVVPEWNTTTNQWVLTTPNLTEGQVIETKRTPVGIDKTVEDVKIVGAQYGDELTFKAVTAVPKYPANASDESKVFHISDTMLESEGLTFTKDSVEVYGMKVNSKDPADATKTLTAADGYFTYTQENAKDLDGNDVTFDINFNYGNIEKDGYTYILVVYKGVLNENAPVGPTGVQNEAKLWWNNNPYDDNNWTTIPTTTTTYTYGIDIVKVDEDNNQLKLEGAQFQLLSNNSAISFVKDGAANNGVYRVATDEDAAASQTTTLTVGEGTYAGQLKISGLNEGTYQLKEVTAPDGYVLSSEIKDIVIKDADADGKLDGNVENQVTAGYVSASVTNSKGFDLPKTGGAGTIALTAAGVVVMAGAAVVLMRSRKHNN